MDALRSKDSELRAEADALLQRHGLRALLAAYGEVFAGGSYALELMTWRDVDLYLRAPHLPVDRFLELGRSIGARLGPRKMSFTNHRDFPSTEGLVGLYWGIHLGDLLAGAWKIDLWALDSAAWHRQVESTAELSARLTPEHRGAILELKTALWNHPQYRKTIGSQLIYDAVSHGGVRTLAEFWTFAGSRAADPPGGAVR